MRDVYCPPCQQHHRAEVALDPTGWPEVTWVEPHDPDAVALRGRRAAILDEAAATFATAMIRGHYEIAGAFAAEVLGDDAEEGS